MATKTESISVKDEYSQNRTPMSKISVHVRPWNVQKYRIRYSSAARGTDFAQGGLVWQVLPLPPARGSAQSHTFVVSARLCLRPNTWDEYTKIMAKTPTRGQGENISTLLMHQPVAKFVSSNWPKKVFTIGQMQQITTNFYWDIKLASIWNYVVWAYHQPSRRYKQGHQMDFKPF